MVGNTIEYTVERNINAVVGDGINVITGDNILLHACYVMGLFAGLMALREF